MLVPVRVRHSSARCTATVPELLNLAATLEALSVSYYYQAISSADGFFAVLPTAYQRYLRVTLDEEWFHYRYLTTQHAATPVNTSFHFPVNIFAVGHFGNFLATMNTLEMATIALYLAAIRQLGEQNEPVLAEIFGQIAGIEAEHRVMGREMAQHSPPAPNDLCFERTDFLCAAEASRALANFLNGGAGFTGPFTLPDQAAITGAVGSSTCEEVATATAAPCADTLADSLGAAAMAEAIGISLYYHGIEGGFFAQLSDPQQWYLQAALDEERNHLNFLLANGATPPPSRFFFPAGIFDDLPRFLDLLDTLENAFISAYLAAIPRLHQLGEPLLAEIAGQILGVESGHRVLGRVMDGQRLPNNRCLALAGYTCITQAVVELTPFVTGNDELTERRALPSHAEIDTAVVTFGCTPVPTASIPPEIFLPVVARG
jgi:hypothetical protein